MGGRRKKGKAKCQLQLGDLVLAKVKGYPAWPAQIGNPEDWDKPPDPRKHFVEFFGTGEIAFVAAADIQVFTEETKARLLSRGQSKKTKSFVQAVEEICEAFNELKENSTSSPAHDPSPPDRSNSAVNLHSDNEVSGSENKVRQSEEKELKSKNENEALNSENGAVECEIEALKSEEEPININSDELHKLEHCSISSKKTVLDDLSLKNPGKSILSAASLKRLDAQKEEGREVKKKDVKKKRIPDKALKEEGREVKKKDVDDNSLEAHTEKTDAAVERLDAQKEVRKRLRSPTEVNSQLDGQEMTRDETTLVKRTKHSPISDMKDDFTPDGPFSKQDEKRSDQHEEKKEARKEKETPLQQDGTAELVSIKPKVSVTLEENHALPDSHKASPSGIKNSTKRSFRENEKISNFKVALGKSARDSSTTSPKKSWKGRTSQAAVTRPQEKVEESVGGKKSHPPDKSRLEASLELTKESKKEVAVEAKKSQPSVQGKKPYLSPSKTLGKSSKGTGEKKVLPKQEDSKSTSKPRPQPTLAPENRSGNNFSAKSTAEKDLLLEERDTSMKHLIAVAQAVRKQVHSHGPSITIPASLLMPGMHDTSSSSPQFLPLSQPGSAVQGNKSMQSSPPLVSSPANPADLEHMHLPSPVYRPESDEAAAKELFEGALEALTRTKDSISRATRQAMECAKFGITNEIMEHLLSKMEVDPSFHRRVDLLFLVDSITQCSNVQKGFAGESFIQTVQSVMPRLLTAVAPAGAAGRENRRQCLKVLKLWMERKILPESLLKKCIADLKNEDPIVDFSSMRRPTRAERNIDDPIRDMEDDFLVDEYGSNTTIGLPGLLTSTFFEEEDEEFLEIKPPSGNISNGDPETKDVSALSKERENILPENPSPIPDSQHDNLSTTSTQEALLAEASKTVPDDQDPVSHLPGEPPSPPPPPPPPTNSPPPPPPPPPSSPPTNSPSGEKLKLPPPPPPPRLPPGPPPGPPPLQVQSAATPQMQQMQQSMSMAPIPGMSQEPLPTLPPLQPPLPPGPPPMQLPSSSVPPAPYFMNQNGPGNAPMQPVNFISNGPCNTTPGYSQNNMHLPPASQMPGTNYSFQQGNMPFHQGPPAPIPMTPQPPPLPPNQPYMQPPCNFRPFPDNCHGPYPHDSFHGAYPPDCFRGPGPPEGYHGLFPPDGFRGPFPSDGGFCGPFPPDNGCPGPFPPEVGCRGIFPPDSYPGPYPPDVCHPPGPPDGYYRPNMERPPFDPISHRHPMPNPIPPGPPLPDHFHPQMAPFRPENPAHHNSWRPG